MKDRKLDRWINAPFDAKRPFLEQLPSGMHEALMAACEVREFDDGQIILRRGVIAENFFIVQSGTAVECGNKHNGRYLEETPVPKGHCFGERSLLSGIATTRTYIAKGFCTMLVMPKEKFFTLLFEAPGMLVVLYRMQADRIANRDKAMDELLRPGVQGDLNVQSFMDIAQTFLNASKTGLVTLDSLGKKAIVGFNNGQLCYAKMRDCEGLDVIDQIIGWEEGKFSYENTEAIGEINLQGDTMGVLLDALRRIDEAAAGGNAGASAEPDMSDSF